MTSDSARRRLSADGVPDEDLRLWREVMRGVRPLPGRMLPPEPPPSQAPAKPLPSSSTGKPVLARRSEPEPSRVPDAVHAPVPGLDRRSAERLRRGNLGIEARLDLHGLTREQAHPALNQFLVASQAAGRRTVLVITGKGGTGSGILKQAVPRWLHEGGNRERVLAYMPARPQHGGEGALYVLLRRRRA